MKSLRLQLRFLLPLGLLLFVAAYITVPLVDRLTLRWFLRDLDIRAQLVAETMTSAIANTPRALNKNGSSGNRVGDFGPF